MSKEDAKEKITPVEESNCEAKANEEANQGFEKERFEVWMRLKPFVKTNRKRTLENTPNEMIGRPL